MSCWEEKIYFISEKKSLYESNLTLKGVKLLLLRSKKYSEYKKLIKHNIKFEHSL